MASGNTLFILTPQGGTPPATLFATLDTLTETSTPNATIPVLDFDGSTDEYMDWHVVVPSHYGGTTGFTFKYTYAMSGVDVDLVELEFSIAKIVDLEIATDDQGLDTATPVPIQDTPIVTVTQDKVAVSPTGTLAKASAGTPVPGGRWDEVADLIISATFRSHPCDRLCDLRGRVSGRSEEGPARTTAPTGPSDSGRASVRPDSDSFSFEVTVPRMRTGLALSAGRNSAHRRRLKRGIALRAVEQSPLQSRWP